jgi:hypothetical protein
MEAAMALFGKGVVWKINQRVYFFRKWWRRDWKWAIRTMVAIAGIIVAYMVSRT